MAIGYAHTSGRRRGARQLDMRVVDGVFNCAMVGSAYAGDQGREARRPDKRLLDEVFGCAVVGSAHTGVRGEEHDQRSNLRGGQGF